MISISKKNWNDIPELTDKDISSELLTAINIIYNNLDSQDKYAYLLEMDFGDFVIHNGVINKKDFTSAGANSFLNDISYSDDPLALVIQNQIEVYTINNCSNRKRIIKEYDSEVKNSIEDKEYLVSLNTILKGDFYGVFGTLDYLSKIERPADHGMDWFAVTGLNSFIFDFPFFHSTISERRDFRVYRDIYRQYDKTKGKYYPAKEQIDFFRKLLPEYKTRVIYFPKHIFEIKNSQLLEKLYYFLLIKGWSQYSPLRNAAFENKVLSDILKNRVLKNGKEFMLKLFDYLRSVFSGSAKVLRTLHPDENHFLNDAIMTFKTNCKDYFNDTKKHFLPLCYVYDDSKKVNIGILSMTNLPILKNYSYTNLEDVLDDLITINEAFKEENLLGYTLDLDRIIGYGGLDRHNPQGIVYLVKGTRDFKKEIAPLFGANEDRILPNYGQFKNTLILKLK